MRSHTLPKENTNLGDKLGSFEPKIEDIERAAEVTSTGAINVKRMIGQEVRFWRHERGFTGAKLAKLAHVSPGGLTKIEQGKVSPSIQTLVSIADALKIPVSILFHRMEKSGYVSFVPADKRMVVNQLGTRAGHIYELLGHNIGHTIAIEPFIVVYTEDSKPYSNFQEEGFKFVHMLEGQITYRHGEREIPLNPGDTLVFDAMTPHGPVQMQKLPTRLMSISFYSRFDPGAR